MIPKGMSDEEARALFLKRNAMAILLYYLQRHEHKFAEISERMEGVVEKSDIRDAINRLMMLGYILKSEDVYRVNVEKLLDLK
jgi:DNA-binding MarR family transcriptional regulator